MGYHLPINFSEIGSRADIKISWQVGEHVDGYPFDGPKNVKAHVFYPLDGRVHFDDEETWTDNNPSIGIDLVSIAVHEIGHNPEYVVQGTLMRECMPTLEVFIII